MIHRALSTIALAALSACTTSIPISRDDSAAAPAPMPAPADARSQTLNVMLERARSDRMAGNLAEAESTLEAALRIAPDDARLWLELAEIQFAAGEFEESRTLAERAMSLSGGDVQIIEAAGRIRALTVQ